MKKRHPFLRRVRLFMLTTVIGGFVIFLPIGLLVGVLSVVYDTITGILSPIRNLVGFSPDVRAWIVNGASILVIVITFFMVGLVIRTSIGRKVHSLIDTKLLGRIPFYSTLRDTVQQFVSRDKTPFKQVVLADVMNVKMTGFVTDHHANGMHTIFVPTTPNPTNGFIFHVKKSDLVFLDVKPDEAMRTIFGMGTGSAKLTGSIDGESA